MTNPALYLLMYGEPTRFTAVIRIGLEHLMDRIRHIAAAGLLRVEERLAVQIVHAAASGAILTWLSVPEPQREPALLVAVRESMVTTVTTREPAIQEQGAAGAARALRAALPSQNALSEAEERLLAEWLRRLSAQPLARGGAASRVNEPDDANTPAFPPMPALVRPHGPWTSGRRSRPPGHGQHTAVGAVGKEPRL